MGSSIIKRAFVAACNRTGGTNLTLDRLGMSIWWQGYGGLTLSNLRQKINLLSKLSAEPDVIVIHCGGNDIGFTPLTEMFSTFKSLLFFLQSRFSKTRLIWSQILPRMKWRYSQDSAAMNRSRIRFNSFAAKSVLNCGGGYIKYPDILPISVNLFLPDQVHLSEVGNNVFLNTLQGGLEQIIAGNCCVYPNTML